MKKNIFYILLMIIPMTVFSQEINIVSQVNEKTIITFKSPDGTPVPIYNILSETSGNLTPDTILSMKEVELLGNTPISLELQNGYYTFQMYKEGDNKFDIIATGENQIWNLKPRGEFYEVGPILTIVGGFGVIGTAAMYGLTSHQKSAYESKLEFYNKNPDFFDNPGEYSGLEYWYAHIVAGTAVGFLVSGIITWMINTPTATQIQ